MAAILRQQVAALIADASANKVSLTSTQSSLTTTQTTVNSTSASLLDVSSNLYRVAKLDVSRNATLQNISSLISSREIYTDRYTYPSGIGPYQIDAIPVLLKDKFKMPKFSSNAAGLQYKNNTFYDTVAVSETVVYVPSKRTTVQTTNLFSQTANTNDNLGHFQISLEDWALLRNNKSNQTGWIGTNLANRVQSFITAASSSATTDASRNALLTAIVTDNDYATIKNNVKLPFKVWNQVKDGNGGFQFSNLLDLSGVPIKNQLVDNSYYNSQVVDSSWPLDINGAPTEILPVAQNSNAINSKMGLFIYFLGNGQLQADPTSMLPSLIASLGYIVLVCAGNPINGDGLVTKSSTTISKLMADKVFDYSLNSYSNDYYISPNTCYGTPDNTTVGSGSYNRINFRNSGMAPEAQPIFERHIYQQLCILKKLGLYNLIDWNNIMAGGMSGGGYALNIVHDMLNSNGKARYFTLNNLDGSSKNINPDLPKVKALLGYQTVHYELSRLTEDQKIPAAYTDDLGRNNQYNIGIGVLKCPMVYINGDGDAYSRSLPYENLFASNAQTIFQLTKKQGDAATDIIFSQCAVIYKPVNGHLTSVATTNDFTEVYVGSLWLNWLNGGLLLPKNVTLPELNNTAATGLQNNIVYMQYDDYKSLIALQLVAHRFLGNNYPLPSSVYSTLGWRVDLMPTHCDITTEYQYVKVGPRTLLSYDASYNLTLTTGATNTSGNLVGNTATLSVDASKNLVTDSKGLSFKDAAGVNHTLTIDASSNVFLDGVSLLSRQAYIDENRLQRYIDTLVNAYETRTPLVYFPLYYVPKITGTPDINFMKNAYLVQDRVVNQLLSDLGLSSIGGYKLSSTGIGLQNLWGSSSNNYYPIKGGHYGAIMSNEIINGSNNDVILKNADYQNIKVEVELGIIMKNNVTTYKDASSILQDISSVCLGFELPSGRFNNYLPGQSFPITSSYSTDYAYKNYQGMYNHISDCASTGCVILGQQVPFTPSIVNDLSGAKFIMDISSVGIVHDPSWNDPTTGGWTTAISNLYRGITAPLTFSTAYSGIEFDPSDASKNPFTNAAYEKSPFGALASLSNKLIYLGKGGLKAGQYISAGNLTLTQTGIAGTGNNYNPNQWGSVISSTPGFAKSLISGSVLQFTGAVTDVNGNPLANFPNVSFKLSYP